jgi:hypothetical protein
MTASELHQILHKALDDTVNVLTPHVKDRPELIPKWRADLLSHLLDPPLCVVAVPKAHARSCKVQFDRLEAYALACKDTSWNFSWLLYAPDSGLFWLAWGKNADSLELSGFDGKDPLDVWLC